MIGTSLTYFRLDESKLLPRYLAAYFRGSDFQNQLKAVMSQTTRNQVPITAQRSLRVVIPPMAIQKSNAAILGALDDRIRRPPRNQRHLGSYRASAVQVVVRRFRPGAGEVGRTGAGGTRC
ncbi:restriction endonuclease subunit S domain-containing protein [Paraburkholderia elongata]|uniref:hypothetical protein n=1 Tax=Paraburkholderia elongata TaxID=2675747 RepID=UPI002E2C5EB2|nr:hypothetical protein [Paraburkholderia elongata]